MLKNVEQLEAIIEEFPNLKHSEMSAKLAEFDKISREVTVFLEEKSFDLQNAMQSAYAKILEKRLEESEKVNKTVQTARNGIKTLSAKKTESEKLIEEQASLAKQVKGMSEQAEKAREDIEKANKQVADYEKLIAERKEAKAKIANVQGEANRLKSAASELEKAVKQEEAAKRRLESLQARQKAAEGSSAKLAAKTNAAKKHPENKSQPETSKDAERVPSSPASN